MGDKPGNLMLASEENVEFRKLTNDWPGDIICSFLRRQYFSDRVWSASLRRCVKLV
jgi:hypothetical protein